MRRLPRSAGVHLKCFTTLVTYTPLRAIPASSKAVLSNFPAGPTNGCPAKSSLSPGCSPTNMILAVDEPSPNTVCVAFFHKSQLRQFAAFARRSSSEAPAGFWSRETWARGFRFALGEPTAFADFGTNLIVALGY